jgi:hypothetical protein
MPGGKPQYSQAYRERNREKERERCRLYRRRYRPTKVRDPVKEKARHAVRNAVQEGKITKPSHCPRCEREINVQAHHEDYSKPFEFNWLCQLCHAQEHRLHRV